MIPDPPASQFQRMAQEQWNALGGQAAAQKQQQVPPGRPVDGRLKDEMLVRRTGNICRQAGEEGWKLSFQQAPGRWKFWFTRGGRAVDAHWHRDRRQALINATEALAPVLGVGTN